MKPSLTEQQREIVRALDSMDHACKHIAGQFSPDMSVRDAKANFDARNMLNVLRCRIINEELITAMLKAGIRLRNKQSDDHATVVFVDHRQVTILVDGYEASNSYDLIQLVQEWEMVRG
jgi:hypothetical protein